jgi:hypothetical protein
LSIGQKLVVVFFLFFAKTLFILLSKLKLPNPKAHINDCFCYILATWNHFYFAPIMWTKDFTLLKIRLECLLSLSMLTQVALAYEMSFND